MKESDKQVLRSVAPLAVVVFLFFVVGRFSISQITNLRDQINTAEKTRSVLLNKLGVLHTISEMPSSETNIALMAVPKNNPAILVISQIRLLATQNAVVVEDIRSSSMEGGTGGLSYTMTSFNVIGPREGVISFIEKMGEIVPLTFVEKVDLSESLGVSEANVYAKTYYAPLPETIPTITQAVSDLTQTDKEILSQVSNFTRLVDIEEDSMSAPSAFNTNPFGD